MAAGQRRQHLATAEPKSIDLEKATLPKDEPPVSTSGALMRANVDPEHWLSAGSDSELHVMVEGTRVFSPITLDKGRNVVTYATGESAVAAGLMWPEARTQLGNKPAVIEQPRGRGHVDRVRRGPELPRLHGRDRAAVHQRRAARPGALGIAELQNAEFQ